ncbi:Elongation of fatty acids protein 3-like [Bienertia sinuspersici]
MTKITTMVGKTIQQITYYLSEHPSIKTFRWSASQSWGSTWSFLVTSISLYLLLSSLLSSPPLSPPPSPPPHPSGPNTSPSLAFNGSHLLHHLLRHLPLLRRRDPRHSLVLAPLQNPLPMAPLLPLGTRPSGRVFFWSYIFYLSRFLHLFRTFFSLLRHRKLPTHHLLNHSILIFSSFLWLEFSQSFQVLAIIFTTLVSSLVYGYRFWTAIGLPSACFPFVLNCQIVLLGCNLICHVGVLLMHFLKGGCNGIGAWGLNSVLNTAILSVFLNFYVKRYLRKSTTASNNINVAASHSLHLKEL